MKIRMLILLLNVVMLFGCNNITNVDTFIKGKNIYVTKSDGKIQQVTFMEKDSNPILAPNKDIIYFIRETGNLGEFEYKGMEQLAIMKLDLSNLREVILTDTIHYKDWKITSKLFRIGNLTLSEDGKFLFFLTQKWAVSSVLVRLSTESNIMTEISHGDDFKLIKEGMYKNHLIVYRSKINSAGRNWSNWLIDINGNQLKELGENESVETLIEKQKNSIH